MPHVLLMPEVAANTTEAVVSSWVVALDEPFRAGDPIVTIETDKAVVDVEAENDGVLVEIMAQPGARVDVGAPIARWSESGTDAQAQPRLFASPLARKLARQHDLELRQIRGTGPRGRIRRIDVDEAIAAITTDERPQALEQAPQQVQATTNSPVPPGPPNHTDVPVSRMRSAIARRLTESKRDAPHFYLRGSAHIDRLLDLRTQVNALPGARRTSVTDWLVKAVGTAHTLEPSLNVEWRGDAIRHFVESDIAVAVATDSGLLTPVVRAVESKSVGTVSGQVADLAERARSRQLRQPELEGGTITLTNLGMYGVEDFAAIINPPQAAILAVGAARREAVPTDDGIGVATVLRFTLAVDHRAVDGAQAAQWLQHLERVLEAPLALLAPFQDGTTT